MSSKNNNTLIIVESPTKAKTIATFLPNTYHIISSYGHMRDLPKSRLGVDVENNFTPSYIVPQKAKAHVKELITAVSRAQEVILATDEDREGETIAWHIQCLIDAACQKGKIKNGAEKKYPRIVFHEITQKAIQEALQHPRALDMHLVDAQQARRIVDRLVGYELSPFLWKKVVRGLSAGRVQSVAVRLIVDREEEIKKHIVQLYWTITATLQKANTTEEWNALLIAYNGKKYEKFDIATKEQAGAIVQHLQSAGWRVVSVNKKETRKYPFPPFTTSTLQQEASQKLHFSAKQTMMIAQQLYEGIHLPEGTVGLITYMRTDSFHLSQDAIESMREVIVQLFGKEYIPPSARHYKTKSKLAQEAHEAIRPTDPRRQPKDIEVHLSPQQAKLYNLIWRRCIACQMESAVFDITTIDSEASIPSEKDIYLFRTRGMIKKCSGFLAVYPLKYEDVLLPDIKENDPLSALRVQEEEHSTQPPPRFTEASLIKALEEYGIGRPSTYAPTLASIQIRGYIDKDEKRRLFPTDIGIKVSTLLVNHFPSIVDVSFTAHMEALLDDIAEGKGEWQQVVSDFYHPFHTHLNLKYEEVQKEVIPEEKTDEVCEKCGKPMVIKAGRFGKFLACSGFPECKSTKTIHKKLDMPCTQCNEGEIVERKTKKKRIFWGCSRYPACDYATWTNPLKRKKEAEETQNQEASTEEEESE